MVRVVFRPCVGVFSSLSLQAHVPLWLACHVSHIMMQRPANILASLICMTLKPNPNPDLPNPDHADGVGYRGEEKCRSGQSI